MNHLLFKCPRCKATNKIPAIKQHLRPKCGRCGEPLEPGAEAIVVELDDQAFNGLIHDSTLPVLVDFYSPTCGPCQMLAPVMASLVRKYFGRIIVAKIDTSRHGQAAAQHQVRGVPTLILFRNGHPVDQMVGAAPEQVIDGFLRRYA